MHCGLSFKQPSNTTVFTVVFLECPCTHQAQVWERQAKELQDAHTQEQQLDDHQQKEGNRA